VRDKLRRLALDLAAEPVGQETQRRFMELLRDLTLFAEKKRCIAPVEGISLVGDDPVTFGPFVVRRATPPAIEEICALTAEALARTLNTPQEQAVFANDFRKQAEELLAGGVILEFEVIADAHQAHDVFIEKARILMDLLQMSTRIAEFCGSTRVGLRGHPHTGLYSAWVLPVNPGDWSQQNKRTGGVGSLCLYDGNLTLMRRAGVMRLVEGLGREATQLENALFRAVYWYAQATLQEQIGQEILFLCIVFGRSPVGVRRLCHGEKRSPLARDDTSSAPTDLLFG
jgi:hypothetical protein